MSKARQSRNSSPSAAQGEQLGEAGGDEGRMASSLEVAVVGVFATLVFTGAVWGMWQLVKMGFGQ